MSRSEFHTDDGTVLSVEAAGDGSPVVFQHGLCGDCGQTGEVFPPDSGLRRVTVEARAHGRSEAGPLEKLSIATFAEDIARYIETKLTGPVVVGGISMGAAISLRLAVTRPDLVKALIVARPAWVTEGTPANMLPNAEAGRMMKHLPAEEAKAAFLSGATAQELSSRAPDNLKSLLGFFEREPRDTTAALLTAIAADGPDVTVDDVRGISVPTLVIGHEKDFIHPLSYARDIAGLIRGSRFAQITPKADDRTRYVAEFRQTLKTFLEAL